MKYVMLMSILICQPWLLSAQSKDEKAVATVVESLRLAMIQADGNMLNSLTEAGLSYGHSSGLVEDRETFVRKIVSGQSDFVTITISDQTIQIHGKTAIVRHTLRAETNDNNKPGQANIKILLVWIKTGSDWKLLARQAVKLSQ